MVFYDLLEEAAANLTLGAQTLHELFEHGDEGADERVAEVRRIEHRGDEITHTIFKELDKTFSLPMDAEDLHSLVAKMDGVLNCINAAAIRYERYGKKEVPDEALGFARILLESVTELAAALGQLRTHSKRKKAITGHIIRINELENESDELYRNNLAGSYDWTYYPLDDAPAAMKHLLNTLKWNDIYEHIEDAVDKTEAVADVVETIISYSSSSAWRGHLTSSTGSMTRPTRSPPWSPRGCFRRAMRC
jgi:predicted phosphate transport protein (TIGR00153 family)